MLEVEVKVCLFLALLESGYHSCCSKTSDAIQHASQMRYKWGIERKRRPITTSLPLYCCTSRAALRGP